ncbi:hypothetical protein MIDIC_10058 [Alphaproteobacteria bacterium]
MTSGFKFDDSLSYKSGRMEVETSSGVQQFINPVGHMKQMSGPGFNMSSYPEKFTQSQTVGSKYSHLISREMSAVQSNMKDFERSKSMVEDSTRSLFQSMARNFGQCKAFAIAQSSDLQASLG